MRYIVSCLVICMLVSCIYGTNDNPPIVEEPYYQPQIISRAELEASVELQPATTIQSPGKIYIYNNLMVVNDVNRGFHIYDYSNPEQPVAEAFLNVPGATDVAIRAGIFYINQAVDLIAVSYDASNNAINFDSRSRNVFPPMVAPDGFFIEPGVDEIIINWIPNN